MSAGIPNYQRLHDMGMLPKDQRSKILGLAQADKLESELENFKKGLCDECREKLLGEKKEEKSSEVITQKCDVADCEFLGEAKSLQAAQNAVTRHKDKRHKTKE